MKIGIDISQIVYKGTGVAAYVEHMVAALLQIDNKNDYILFGASLRKKNVFQTFYSSLPHTNARLVTVSIPPTVLEFLWNRLHIVSIERFTGPLDVFWSSDWTQPPVQSAKLVTTIHDLITFRFPEEMASAIVQTHARRLKWVKKECAAILCDSVSTKKDVMEFLHIPEDRLHVVYLGRAV